jgi:hypothetical protein
MQSDIGYQTTIASRKLTLKFAQISLLEVLIYVDYFGHVFYKTPQGKVFTIVKSTKVLWTVKQFLLHE